MANAFHQAAVTSNDIRVMINCVCSVNGAKMLFGNSHSHCVCEALAKRTCGDFNSGGVTSFGVAWRCRIPLTEILQVIESETPATQVQH